jgi:nucleoside-diphosphate-sugar epimerase
VTNLLITGATGFVGTYLLPLLRIKRVEPRLIVRSLEKLNSLSGSFEQDYVRVSENLFAESDTSLDYFCSNVDTVVHLAWDVDHDNYVNSPKQLDCLTGTLSLAKACARNGVRRFIGIGTCLEYDLKEGYVHCGTAINPLSLYAASKAASFMCLQEYFKINNIEFSWIRLFYLYGQGEHQNRLVPYIESQIQLGKKVHIKNGHFVRDYLPIEMVAKGIAQIVLGNHNGTFNLCSGKGISIREFAESIADRYSRRNLLFFSSTAPSNDPPIIVGVDPFIITA